MQLVEISSRLQRLEDTVADMSTTIYGDRNHVSITDMVSEVKLSLTQYISEARGRADERKKMESKFRWIIGIILTAIGLLIAALQVNHQIKSGEIVAPSFHMSELVIYTANVRQLSAGE